MQSANELLEWVESNLNQDVLHERPPGELDRLLHNSEGIKVHTTRDTVICFIFVLKYFT